MVIKVDIAGVKRESVCLRHMDAKEQIFLDF